MDFLNDILITEKEATDLGIINGLGFVYSPQTAFKKVNSQILAELKKGNLIFRKPWRDGYKIKGVVYGAHNYVTLKSYHGANAYYISLQNIINKTNYKQFLTLKQIKDYGGTLKKEAEGYPVWAFIKNLKTETNSKTGDLETTEQKGIISYVVYPLEHTIGVKPIKHKVAIASPDEINSDAETIIENMPKRPTIKHGGDEAYYVPSNDFVQMPLKKAFNKVDEYYSTLFHELAHSTGNKKRIGRDLSGTKGNTKYALEELIAELSAAYLCSVCDMPYYTLNNTAAYLKNWASVLYKEIQANPRFLLRAVYGATKAAKYIISNTLEKANIEPTTKEITPNKNIKASITEAIKDLVRLTQYKKIGAMALGMLFNKFKNSDTGDSKEIGTGLDDKTFGKLNDFGFVEYLIGYSSKAVLTNEGKEIIKKIQSRYDTLKGKKSGTDLFPELGCNKCEDIGLSFIQRFLNFDGKTINQTQIESYISDVNKVIETKKITKQHPYKKQINSIISRLHSLYKQLDVNEFVQIKLANIIDLQTIIDKEQKGLGFLPIVLAAAAGKAVEYLAHKHFSKNNGLNGTSKFPIKIGKIGKPLINNTDVPSGNIYLEKGNSQKGFLHILKYSNALKKINHTPQSFTEWIVKNFTHIYYDRAEYILVYQDLKNSKVLILALKQNKVKNYYSIISAGWKNKNRFKNKKPLWSRSVFPNDSLSGLNRDFQILLGCITAPIKKHAISTKVLKNTIKLQKKSIPQKQNLSGVMSVTDAINGKFDLIGLDGDYLKLIGEACKPTSFFIYGPGGSGKSSFTLKFANYMAQKGNKILYVAGEQFNTPVFSKMLQRLKIVDTKNFVIVKDLQTVSPKNFDFIAIDSKDSLNFQINDYVDLHKKYPHLSFVILSQGTKGGSFTGSEKWRNMVDTMIYCEQLIAYTNQDKNRWGASEEINILKLK